MMNLHFALKSLLLVENRKIMFLTEILKNNGPNIFIELVAHDCFYAEFEWICLKKSVCPKKGGFAF